MLTRALVPVHGHYHKIKMKYNIYKTYFVSWLEASVKIWEQYIVSSRAKGDRVRIYSTKFSIQGSKGLGRRKAHLTGLIRETGRHFSVLQIPDVSEFDIVLGLINPLLLAFGIVGRYGAEVKLTRYRNRKMNKYLLHVFTVLLGHLKAGRVSRFWTLSMILVKRSTVYMIACTYKIDKNIYRNLGQRELVKTFSKVRSLRSELSTNMDFKRTYIPKGDNDVRPLGVPTLPWRIYLNMLLHPLVLAHPLPASQHGFKPGFGTLTAWVSMFKDVLPSKNIYEGDIRQCFPSVNLLRLAVHLYKSGMPAEVLGLYHLLNQVSPQFKGQILQNENQFLLRDQYLNLLAADPSRSPENFDLPIWQYDESWVREQILLHGEEAIGIHGEVLLNFLDSSRDQAQFETILEGLMQIMVEFKAGTPIEDYVHNTDFLKYIGTAQGSPLSPYLTALSLTQVSERLPKGVYILFYADDFILYGPGLTDETLEEVVSLFKSIGFTIHPKKSRWVVKDGSPQIDSLKFLGLTYSLQTNTLSASTRKGSTLEFTKGDLVAYEYDKGYSLSRTPEQIYRESKKFSLLSLLGIAPQPRLASALAWYYRSLAHFRKWFVTELQFDILALILQLLKQPSWIIRRFLTLGLQNLGNLNTARAFAQSMYSESKSISVKVESSDRLDMSTSENIQPYIIQAINYVNPYLRKYRSKYTFVNYCASRYKGLILSRLYSGSWIQSIPLQNFKFSYRKTSLAQLISVYLRKPNVFIGSSIAANLLIKALSSANRSKRFNQKFQRSLIENSRKLRYDPLLRNVG